MDKKDTQRDVNSQESPSTSTTPLSSAPIRFQMISNASLPQQQYVASPSNQILSIIGPVPTSGLGGQAVMPAFGQNIMSSAVTSSPSKVKATAKHLLPNTSVAQNANPFLSGQSRPQFTTQGTAQQVLTSVNPMIPGIVGSVQPLPAGFSWANSQFVSSPLNHNLIFRQTLNTPMYIQTTNPQIVLNPQLNVSGAQQAAAIAQLNQATGQYAQRTNNNIISPQLQPSNPQVSVPPISASGPSPMQSNQITPTKQRQILPASVATQTQTTTIIDSHPGKNEGSKTQRICPKPSNNQESSQSNNNMLPPSGKGVEPKVSSGSQTNMTHMSMPRPHLSNLATTSQSAVTLSTLANSISLTATPISSVGHYITHCTLAPSGNISTVSSGSLKSSSPSPAASSSTPIMSTLGQINHPHYHPLHQGPHHSPNRNSNSFSYNQSVGHSHKARSDAGNQTVRVSVATEAKLSGNSISHSQQSNRNRESTSNRSNDVTSKSNQNVTGSQEPNHKANRRHVEKRDASTGPSNEHRHISHQSQNAMSQMGSIGNNISNAGSNNGPHPPVVISGANKPKPVSSPSVSSMSNHVGEQPSQASQVILPGHHQTNGMNQDPNKRTASPHSNRMSSPHNHRNQSVHHGPPSPLSYDIHRYDSFEGSPPPDDRNFKPHVLTHVIDGYIIQESSDPFPINGNMNGGAQTDSEVESMPDDITDEMVPTPPKKRAMSPSECENAAIGQNFATVGVYPSSMVPSNHNNDIIDKSHSPYTLESPSPRGIQSKNAKGGENPISGSHGRKANKVHQNDEPTNECTYARCGNTISQAVHKQRKGLPFCSVKCADLHFPKENEKKQKHNPLHIINEVTQPLVDPEVPVAPSPYAVENGNIPSQSDNGPNATNMERTKGRPKGKKGPKTSQSNAALDKNLNTTPSHGKEPHPQQTLPSKEDSPRANAHEEQRARGQTTGDASVHVETPRASNDDYIPPGGRNPLKWTVEDVYLFVCNLPGVDEATAKEAAEDFRSQEIDGQALMLLKEDHLVHHMGIKLGPALKICAKLNMLKEETQKGS